MYNSEGIEGSTISLHQVKQIMFKELPPRDVSNNEIAMILCHKQALALVYSLLSKMFYITDSDICEIHKTLMLLDPRLIGGKYRNHNVVVGNSKTLMPEYDEIPSLMLKLNHWIASCAYVVEDCSSLRAVRNIKVLGKSEPQMPSVDSSQIWLDIVAPILYAAELHHKFVRIHPFSDGNGRVARLLMKGVLLSAGYPPIIITVNEKLQYFSALEKCTDTENRKFFYDFILQKSIDSLEYYVKKLSW